MQDVSFDGKGAITGQRAKNRHTRRIPMTNCLKAVLQAYVIERGALPTDVLFVGIENEPLSGRTIQIRLKEYRKATKVVNEGTVSPHAFIRNWRALKWPTIYRTIKHFELTQDGQHLKELRNAKLLDYHILTVYCR